MHFLQRARCLGMFGFGFKAGGSKEDPEKENKPEASPAASPWLKRQKVSPDIDLAAVRRKLPFSTSLVSPDTSQGVLNQSLSPSPSSLALATSFAGESPDNKHTNLVKAIRYIRLPFKQLP